MVLLGIIKLVVACGALVGIIGIAMFLASLLSCCENIWFEGLAFIIAGIGVGVMLLTAIVGLVLKVIGLF